MNARLGSALVVFARAPVPGQAKTRLVPALGAAGAARLAERMIEGTMAHALAAGFQHVELCVTPDASHPAFARVTAQHRVPVGLQGEGDLGARMARALERTLAHHERALLVGTDAPSLDAARLREAAAALATHDAVFVPALDGGYALVGMRRPAPALFDGIAWSTPHVMAATRDRARAAGLRWVELDPVPDIDEPPDLVHLPAGWIDGGTGGAA